MLHIILCALTFFHAADRDPWLWQQQCAVRKKICWQHAAFALKNTEVNDHQNFCHVSTPFVSPALMNWWAECWWVYWNGCSCCSFMIDNCVCGQEGSVLVLCYMFFSFISGVHISFLHLICREQMWSRLVETLTTMFARAALKLFRLWPFYVLLVALLFAFLQEGLNSFRWMTVVYYYI